MQRIQTLAPYFKANGVYPLFLTWRTGPTETLSGILEDELQESAAARRRLRRRVRARQGDGRRSARSHGRSARTARGQADLEPDEAERRERCRTEPRLRAARRCAGAAETASAATGDPSRRPLGRLDNPRTPARPAAGAQARRGELPPLRAGLHGALRARALRARDRERGAARKRFHIHLLSDAARSATPSVRIASRCCTS